MKETKGAWCEHPVFKEMDDAVEIVNWMRGKYPKIAKKRKIKNKLMSLRQKAEARGITEYDVEEEIKAYRAGKYRTK